MKHILSLILFIALFAGTALAQENKGDTIVNKGDTTAYNDEGTKNVIFPR